MQGYGGYLYMPSNKIIEKEIKILISKLQFERLIDFYKIQKKGYHQINYYYYCSGMKDNTTIRIRKKGEQLFLQIKSPVDEVKREYKSEQIRNEFEKPINKIPNIITKKEISEMCGIAIEDVQLIGQMDTLRYEIPMNSSTLCLDFNEYLNINDYELEVEYIENIPLEVFEIFHKFEIDYSKSSRGKFSRFLQQYLKKEN